MAEGASFCTYQNGIIKYGGLNPEDGLSKCAVIIYKPGESETLKPESVYPDNPENITDPRFAFSTAFYLNDYLHIFGGCNLETGWSNGMFRLKMSPTMNSKWEIIKCSGNIPLPRDKHCGCLWGRKYFIFGGFGPSNVPESSDSDNEELEKVSNETEEKNSDANKPQSNGDVKPEDEDSSSSDEDQSMLSCNFSWFNDLYEFDSDNNAWNLCRIRKGQIPTKRAGATLNTFETETGTNLILFGGKTSEGRQNDVNIFVPHQGSWIINCQVNGAPPCGRSFHAASILTMDNKPYLLISGGRDNENAILDDFYVIDLKLWTWNRLQLPLEISPSRGMLESRSCHAVFSQNDIIYIVGGVADYDEETLLCKTVRSPETYKWIQFQKVMVGTKSVENNAYEKENEASQEDEKESVKCAGYEDATQEPSEKRIRSNE